MNFSYLNDRDELFFFPTDDSAEQIFPVQAMNGARYIISDHNNADIISLVTADRHNNDLHLTLPSASPTTMVVKDFYLTNGKVFTLNPKGEYQQHIASQHDAAQGPVVVESQPAVMQETQPEVASLKVIQRAETVQSLEQLATSLNLSDAVTPQAPAIATPMAQPASLMALQEEPGVSVKPSITTMYDEVGARTGMLYSGSVTDDKLPLIQGVGQPGATLEFFQNGELIGYTTVNQAGEWSFTFDIPLEEGGQLFYVRDPATSQTSSYVVLIIDTVAPARAELSSITADNTGSIVALAKNGYTSDNTPTFSGKGEANSMIAIYNDKTLIGTTYADANGIWSFTPPYALPDGVYAGRAVAIDFSGNTGLSSAKFDFIIDTVPPAQPQIIEILDNEGTVTGPVANGAGTDDSTPTLNGHAEAGSRVTIFDNGVKVADVQSDAAGNWSYTPGAELNPGSHTFTVTATDMTGNVSTESLPWSIILVPGQPDVPVVDAVYDDRGETTLPVPSGDTTADATPLIRGSAEPDSVVIIYDNGKEIARVNTDSEGSWVFTPDAALDDGEHALTFVTQNPAGNQSEPSDPWVVIVDTTAPDAPVIGGVYDDVGNKTGNLANGDSTDDTRPTLNGTAEAGSVIAVYDNGEKLGETTADENGNWSFTPETDLSEGEHSLTVTATDTVGNTSVPSDAWELVIDTTAPVQPGIDGEGPGLSGVTDDKGPITGPIENGGSTDDDTPTFNGTGNPGDTVIVTDNGQPIGAVVIGEDGTWTFTPETGLDDGDHAISVIIQDPAGNQSAPSDPWVVTVDTTAPDAPVIGGVYDDVGVKTGNLNNGDMTDDTRPTLNGTAEAGSVVAVYDNSEKLGETTADENGNWSFTPEAELNEGEHSLTVTATDTVGNTSEPSAPWELVIDTTAPTQPGIDGEGPGLSGVTDDKGPITGPIENGGSTDDDTPTFNGTGNPGDTVIVTDNGQPIGEVVIGEDGTWTFTPETGLEDGEHEVSIIIQDPAGNQSEPSEPWVVIVDTIAPDAPVIGSITDDVGVKTGNLANGDSTDDTRPTLNGTAEAGSVIAVYDNGEKLGEATADENGNWSFTPATDLSEGEHSLTVTATDTVGNTSVPSDAWELVIDTTAPVQPGIDGEGPGLSGVTDDKGPITGPIENGGSTDDDTPTFNGTGNPGDTVIVTDNGQPIGEVVIGEDGTWTFTPETGLEDGEHEVSIIIQDPAGNQSEPSEPWVVIVDTTAPDAPVIGSLYDDVGSKTGNLSNGESTDDTRPTLNGTAEAGAVITVYDNGEKLGETTADQDGNWSFTPTEELDAGKHSLTVTATDAVGNTSGPSDVWETQIVLSLPDAPVIESVMDDVGPQTGELKSGDVTDDRRPEVKGQSEPGATVILYDRNVEIGRTQADGEGHWSVTPQSDLNDGVYQFTAVVQDDAGNISPASDAFEVVIYSGDGPTQIARVGQMGKDSGYDGNDFVTDNGDAGRLMYGTLSAELTAGLRLQVSTDGGRTWSDAMVEGTQWAAQDQYEHAISWNIQTRVVDQSGNAGFVMQQAVTLDVSAPRAPSAVQLDGTSLVVDFASAGLVAGDRLSVVTDSGAHRFEHTLTADDIAAGSVSVDVGTASTASAALIDMAGNQSSFVTTSGLAPSVNMDVKGDVSELYGQGRDNVFSVADVNTLDNVKVIEGNGGVDTLKLTGADQVLDLSSWQGRLSSVEVIDITGSGNNTLKLSLGDVLDQGHTGAFINDDSVQMAVKGNAGDVVMLSDLLPNGMDVGDWENLGEVVAAGVSYDVYHHSELGAELLIQQGVTVQFS